MVWPAGGATVKLYMPFCFSELLLIQILLSVFVKLYKSAMFPFCWSSSCICKWPSRFNAAQTARATPLRFLGNNFSVSCDFSRNFRDDQDTGMRILTSHDSSSSTESNSKAFLSLFEIVFQLDLIVFITKTHL